MESFLFLPPHWVSVERAGECWCTSEMLTCLVQESRHNLYFGLEEQKNTSLESRNGPAPVSKWKVLIF